MAETLNKRIMPALAAEARENARRYWAKKEALRAATASPAERQGTGPGIPNPDDPKDGKVRFQ